MTNPITHLIWGYLLGRAVSPAPKYMFLGMMAAIVLDVDQIVPGLTHHGFVHSPIFVLALSGLLYAVTRDRLVFWVSLAAMLSHLVLDTVATQFGVMWLWPVSNHEFVIWTLNDLAALAVIKVYAFLLPAYWIWHHWKVNGEHGLLRSDHGGRVVDVLRPDTPGIVHPASLGVRFIAPALGARVRVRHPYLPPTG
jgi:hypothetical protein